MWFRSAVIAYVSVLLSGCGFHLRGADISQLESVQITASRGHQAIRTAFLSLLSDHGVTSSPSADLMVRIDSERSYRRPIATTANIDTAEYELRLEVDIVIKSPEKEVEATLVSERVYAVNRGNLSGSYEEQSVLLSEMRAELARLMIRRVEAVAIRKPS